MKLINLQKESGGLKINGDVFFCAWVRQCTMACAFGPLEGRNYFVCHNQEQQLLYYFSAFINRFASHFLNGSS